MSQITTYTIGEAAASSGLTTKMIRNYETLGLIQNQRSAGNYRIYGESDIEQMRFIKHARSLDFSLKQIAELMDLWHNTNRCSADVKKLALQHKKAIEQRIQDLQSLERQLDELIGACKGSSDSDCAILKGLANHS
ncbi:MAG: MerR family DNA-binding protein [Cellvibrio sp.]